VKPYYEHAGITIYHGDCRELLPMLQADLVVTDPPYGMRKAEWDEAIVPVNEWLPTAVALGPVALFCGVRGLFDYPRPDWTGAWVRLASTQRNGSLRGFNNWEPILFYGVTELSNDVIAVSNRREIDGHPTPKPVRLMSALLSRMPDGIVADPFCGTGTTLVAAKRAWQNAIGIEIEERYCEIAAKRLSQEVLPLEDVS
jgi:DNA modification methylase